MSRLFWEDFAPGQIFEHGPLKVPRDEMIAFAAEFDPQPMHLDEEAARGTMMGGLCASGWYVCGLMMRMSVDAFLHNSNSMGAPGVDEVKWLAPVHPNDRLRLRATVLETRSSKSRPELGFVRFAFEVLRDGGEPVMMLTTSLMQRRRNPGGVQ